MGTSTTLMRCEEWACVLSDMNGRRLDWLAHGWSMAFLMAVIGKRIPGFPFWPRLECFLNNMKTHILSFFVRSWDQSQEGQEKYRCRWSPEPFEWT